ncbi:MAG: hypothetical protein VKP70_04850 [Cyanobacteriota bacterium]|nr:hypothetical protein [Cyanobacteriota bacterium]
MSRRWAGGLRGLLVIAAVLLTLVGSPLPAAAADLRVEQVSLTPCSSEDAGNQPAGRTAASCHALRGEVINPTTHVVVDTDLFAVILDASGEPVLPNRARVGSLGDVPPGRSPFAVRLAVPAGTPGPFRVGQVKARGFRAPVRTRAGEGDERLPLELDVAS